MALVSGSYIIGNSDLRFCPAGTTLAVGVASVTNKPASPTDDNTYLSLPCVDSAELTSTSNDKEIYCPNPGARVLTSILTTDHKQSWKFSLKELNSTLYKMLIGTSTLTGSSPHTPNEKIRRLGWLHFEQYSQDNVLLYTWDVWCSLKPDGATTFGADVVTASIMVDVLAAADNEVVEA